MPDSEEIAERLVLDAQPGPARPLSAADESALVARILQQAKARPDASVRKRRRWHVLIAAALLVTGAAAAQRLLRSEEEPMPVLSTQLGASLEMAKAKAKKVEVRPEPKVASAQPEGETPPPTFPAAKRGADLLRQANQLRGERKWQAAAAMYARVMREYPGTPAASAARIAVADLKLHHLGDAEGAQKLYAAAQQEEPRGALSEEAAWGMVEAHRARGDAAAERDALRSFLQRFPNSALAGRARSRLEQIQ